MKKLNPDYLNIFCELRDANLNGCELNREITVLNGYTKTLNHWKTLQNTQKKQQSTETKKIVNKLQARKGPGFYICSILAGGRQPVSYATDATRQLCH